LGAWLIETNGIKSSEKSGTRKKLKVVDFDVVEVSDLLRSAFARLM
jgi:molybdopterin/thiamine biosynthesis adenylyltransferase